MNPNQRELLKETLDPVLQTFISSFTERQGDLVNDPMADSVTKLLLADFILDFISQAADLLSEPAENQGATNLKKELTASIEDIIYNTVACGLEIDIDPGNTNVHRFSKLTASQVVVNIAISEEQSEETISTPVIHPNRLHRLVQAAFCMWKDLQGKMKCAKRSRPQKPTESVESSSEMKTESGTKLGSLPTLEPGREMNVYQRMIKAFGSFIHHFFPCAPKSVTDKVASSIVSHWSEDVTHVPPLEMTGRDETSSDEHAQIESQSEKSYPKTVRQKIRALFAKTCLTVFIQRMLSKLRRKHLSSLSDDDGTLASFEDVEDFLADFETQAGPTDQDVLQCYESIAEGNVDEFAANLSKHLSDTLSEDTVVTPPPVVKASIAKCIKNFVTKLRWWFGTEFNQLSDSVVESVGAAQMEVQEEQVVGDDLDDEEINKPTEDGDNKVEESFFMTIVNPIDDEPPIEEPDDELAHITRLFDAGCDRDSPSEQSLMLNLNKAYDDVVIRLLVSRTFSKMGLSLDLTSPLQNDIAEWLLKQLENCNLGVPATDAKKLPKALHKLIWKDLCEKYGGKKNVHAAMMAHKKEFANLVTQTLVKIRTEPPKKSCVSQFFSSLAKCFRCR